MAIVVGAIAEVGFLGGIGLTAYGCSEFVNNKNKGVSALEIASGIVLMVVTSQMKYLNNRKA
jgi:hypothetical protein